MEGISNDGARARARSWMVSRGQQQNNEEKRRTIGSSGFLQALKRPYEKIKQLVRPLMDPISPSMEGTEEDTCQGPRGLAKINFYKEIPYKFASARPLEPWQGSSAGPSSSSLASLELHRTSLRNALAFL